MPKLTPTNPSEVMVIRNITPSITTLSVPFWRFGRVKIGGRGTLGMLSTRDAIIHILIPYLPVKLKSGGVAVFSPVALTDEVKKAVSSMGDVKYIAAPDAEVRPQPRNRGTDLSSDPM